MATPPKNKVDEPLALPKISEGHRTGIVFIGNKSFSINAENLKGKDVSPKDSLNVFKKGLGEHTFSNTNE
jgi:hypothetical protein